MTLSSSCMFLSPRDKNRYLLKKDFSDKRIEHEFLKENYLYTHKSNKTFKGDTSRSLLILNRGYFIFDGTYNSVQKYISKSFEAVKNRPVGYNGGKYEVKGDTLIMYMEKRYPVWHQRIRIGSKFQNYVIELRGLISKDAIRNIEVSKHNPAIHSKYYDTISTTYELTPYRFVLDTVAVSRKLKSRHRER